MMLPSWGNETSPGKHRNSEATKDPPTPTLSSFPGLILGLLEFLQLEKKKGDPEPEEEQLCVWRGQGDARSLPEVANRSWADPSF